MNELYLKEATGATFSDNPAEFTMKVKRFANKTIDLVVQRCKYKIAELHNDSFTGEILTHPKTLDANEERLKELEVRERAERRARQMVQFAVRQIDADHMITLTTRESFTSREAFFKVFSKFIKLVRTHDLVNGELVQRMIKKTPFSKLELDKRSFAFVAVPELQERGAYHMHMGVYGRQDIALLRACWYVALGGSIGDTKEHSKGAVNVTYAQNMYGSETPHFKKMKLVNYLVKYVAKTFAEDGLTGVHRYTKSRGIPKPETKRYYLNSCFYMGNIDFIDVIHETIQHAKTLGVAYDYTLFNRNEDCLILRGTLQDWAFEGLPF